MYLKNIAFIFLFLSSQWSFAKTLPFGLSVPKSTGVPTGSFKGYEKINDLVTNRIAQTSYFELTRFIVSSGGDSIKPLLGTFQGVGSDNEYANGKPNAVNMFLWRKILGGMAKEISHFCLDGNSVENQVLYNLNDTMQYFVGNVCVNPTKENIAALWIYLIGFEADDEFEEYYLSLNQINVEVVGLSNFEYLEGVLYSMFMNPHFLIEN